MFEETKVCSKCKEVKAISSFPYKKAPKKQSYCKECQKEYGRLHYAKNKEDYIARNKIYEQTIRDHIDNLKSKPCHDCSQSFPPICMDFDHVNGQKIQSVSQLMNSNSLKRLLLEIEKCELVCACCHRIRTQNRYHNTKSE